MVTIHQKERWITDVTITICCFVLFTCQGTSENVIGDTNHRPTSPQSIPTSSLTSTQNIPQPSPTATRSIPKPKNTSIPADPHTDCAPLFGDNIISQYIVDWTTDGAHLVFSDVAEPERSVTLLRVIDTRGSVIRTLVNANPDHAFDHGFHAEVSPNNSHIVYTSCEFKTDVDIKYPDDWWADLIGVNYEIATIALDGSSKKRLTESEHVDHFPSWSPDGSEIAFVGESDPWTVHVGGHLLLMQSDGSSVRRLAPSIETVTFWPPRWAPDGRHLAFVANQRLGFEQRRFLHTFSVDEEELTFITETSTLPAWSPDGKKIAFGRNKEREFGSSRITTEVGLYTTSHGDGVLQKLWSNDSFGEDRYGHISISHIVWSPLGTEIAFVFRDLNSFSEIYVLNVEHGTAHRLGDELRCIPSGFGTCEIALDWSPDGSMLAVYYPGARLVLVSGDGSNVRTLAESIDGGSLEIVELNQ